MATEIDRLVGVIEFETGQLRSELKRIEGAVKNSTDRSAREFSRLDRAMQGTQRVANQLRAVLATIGVVALGRQVVNASVSFERIQNSLRAATGSAAAAGREFSFVRSEAERLGLDLETSALQFSKLAAAARGTALEGQAARDIFTAISEASTVMGLSADQTSGALTAIEQIISKGTVSAEELRGQLGERLPGAFQIAARSIGVTTAELGKMLEQGELGAERLLPALAKELRKTFGPEVANAARSTQASINRFRTTLFELQVEFGRSGFLDGLTDGLEAIREALQDEGFRQGLQQFSQFIGSSIKFIVDNADKIAVATAGLGAFATTTALLGRGRLGLTAGALAGGVAAELTSREFLGGFDEFDERLSEARDNLAAAIRLRDKAQQAFQEAEFGAIFTDSNEALTNAATALRAAEADVVTAAAAFEGLHSAVEGAEDAMMGSIPVTEESVATTEKLPPATEEFSKAAQKVIDSLEDELAAIGKTGKARELAIALRKAETSETTKAGQAIKKLVDRLDEARAAEELRADAMERSIAAHDALAEANQQQQETIDDNIRAKDDLLAALDDEIELERLRLSLVNADERTRKARIRLLEIEQQAQRDANDAILENLEAFETKIAQSTALEAQREEIEQFLEDIKRTSEEIADDVTDFFVDGFTRFIEDGKVQFEDFFDGIVQSARRFIIRLAAEFLKQQIILPITTAIVGDLSGLFGIQRPAGGVPGRGSVIDPSQLPLPPVGNIPGDPLGIQSFLNTPVFGGGPIGFSGASSAFGSSAVFTAQSGGLANAIGVAPVAGGVTNAAVPAAGATLGNIAGGVGLGFFAGSLLPSFGIGNAGIGNTLGSGGGALAGSLAGAAIGGPAGALIGGAAGGLLGGGIGGLFGGEVDPGPPQSFAKGLPGAIQGLTDNGGDAAQAVGALNQVFEQAAQIADQLGVELRVTADAFLQIDQESGRSIARIGDAMGQFSDATEAQSFLLEELVSRIVKDLDPAFQMVIDVIGDIETAVEAINFIRAVEELPQTVEEVRELNEVLSPVQEELKRVNAEFDALIEEAERLQLATGALAEEFEVVEQIEAARAAQIGFLIEQRLEEAAATFALEEQISAFRASILAVEGALEAAVDDLMALGASEDQLNQVREQAAARIDQLANAELDRIRAFLDANTLRINDPDEAQRKALFDQFNAIGDEVREAAEAAGLSATELEARLDEVRAAYFLALDDLNAQLDGSAASAERAAAAVDNFGTALEEFLDRQQLGAVSSLSPVEQLRQAQEVFDEQLEEARLGDTDALNRIITDAQNLLNAQAAVTSIATVDFAAFEALIRSQLEQLGQALDLPGFQEGGRVLENTLAVVGERGREIVRLPRGAEVLRNSQTETILSGLQRPDRDQSTVIDRMESLFRSNLRDNRAQRAAITELVQDIQKLIA